MIYTFWLSKNILSGYQYFCNISVPAGLQTTLLDSGGPGREPVLEDNLGPGQSQLGSVVQTPGPAADTPPTVHPSCLKICPNLKLDDTFNDNPAIFDVKNQVVRVVLKPLNLKYAACFKRDKYNQIVTFNIYRWKKGYL